MITSTANPYVKRIRSLCADRRERHRERSFLLEGVRLLNEALAASTELRLVLYAPDQLSRTVAGQQLLEQLVGQSNTFEATAHVVAAATDTVTPQGVVAVAAWPELEPARGVSLILDAVQDPGNVGTLLRSAEASGIGQVYCSRGTADVYSPKVVRAAMGAHFYLPLRVDLTWDEIDVALAGLPHVYAAVAGASMPYYAADWRQPVALIIGNETHGVSAEGLSRTTRQIAIPMAGHIDSLNAGIAGSIMLFEALRQRSHGRRSHQVNN
ncbi:MAG: RNA methyltransferase [Chloroflexales bacterium]|nr:RNA methyltransferase [Chloroflexales bacterium]